MSSKLLFTCLLYFLMVLLFLGGEKTAEASTQSFSVLSANSFYEPPTYIIPNGIITVINSPTTVKESLKSKSSPKIPDNCTTKIFRVSAYNSLIAQTDNTPCIPASGKNICGRTNVVACPREYLLGTRFIISSIEYICEDRLAERFDNSIDIFFDKDLRGALEWGIQYKQVQVCE